MSSIIIAGATGAIGRELVVQAVVSPHIIRVVALSRKELSQDAWAKVFPDIDMAHAKQKLEVVAVDWERITNSGVMNCTGEVVAALRGHTIAAMCMGTTRKDAGSDAAFERCDYDYVKAFAAAVKEASGSTIRHYAQVSSDGANASSMFLYLRTKGKADEMAIQMGFPSTSIYRPGMLGRKEKARAGERFVMCCCCCLGVMPVEVVAEALLKVSLDAVRQDDTASPSPVVLANAAIKRSCAIQL